MSLPPRLPPPPPPPPLPLPDDDEEDEGGDEEEMSAARLEMKRHACTDGRDKNSPSFSRNSFVLRICSLPPGRLVTSDATGEVLSGASDLEGEEEEDEVSGALPLNGTSTSFGSLTLSLCPPPTLDDDDDDDDDDDASWSAS